MSIRTINTLSNALSSYIGDIEKEIGRLEIELVSSENESIRTRIATLVEIATDLENILYETEDDYDFDDSDDDEFDDDDDYDFF